MTTTQFFKGLFMAIMSIIVVAFSQTPIDYLLLTVTAVCTVLIYSGKNLIAVLHSDSPAGALSWINLLSGVLIAVGTGALESAGLFLINGIILWAVVWKVALSALFTYLGSTFFAPPYSTAKNKLFV
jgi:hypothetical protein